MRTFPSLYRETPQWLGTNVLEPMSVQLMQHARLHACTSQHRPSSQHPQVTAHTQQHRHPLPCSFRRPLDHPLTYGPPCISSEGGPGGAQAASSGAFTVKRHPVPSPVHTSSANRPPRNAHITRLAANPEKSTTPIIASHLCEGFVAVQPYLAVPAAHHHVAVTTGRHAAEVGAA